jgi:hypothetical protein
MIRPSLYRALAAAALALLPTALFAHPVPVPDVPAILEVEPGHRPYLMGHAVGTQNYVCLPSTQTESGVAWTLFGPQATLFDDRQRQTMTHFLSPNPDQADTPRATWHHSDDSSTAWAVKAQESTVDPTAIPWLLLRIVGNEDGPTGGGKLSDTTFIQRINTVAGKAPATGCESAGNLGAIRLVPYETDHVFYRAQRRN